MSPAALLAHFATSPAPLTPMEAAALTDAALIDTQRQLAEARRRVDASASVVAAEIAHRSRRELGYDGLAQSRGMRTPEALVQQVTGLSGADARSLVRVGTLVIEHDPIGRDTGNATPWLVAVAKAVARGALTVDAAEAIRVGLGEPTDDVPATQLTGAADRLVGEARSLTLERLAALARQLRDELDEAGIADREQQRRDRRYLSLTLLSDGMTRISGLLDPESAAIVTGAVDAVTSPRRGGPRFVDTVEAERAERLLHDPRTTPQLALDTLVDLVRVATLADTGIVLGARRVAVRVHVTDHDLRRGVGAAVIEGQPDAASIATAERHVCESGIVPVLFDSDGQVINVGRQQRRFTSRQRIGLAARDGGCRFPDCERPPSFTEAHHIDNWHHGGRTDLADGILICRHHHLLLHNNGWRVVRERADYWLVPPVRPDAVLHRVPMPPKHPLKHWAEQLG